MNNELQVRLKEQSDVFIEKIDRLEITNQTDYDWAEEFAKEVKSLQKEVEGYWEPLRKSTYEAYSKVNANKKEMLNPLKDAEKLIKSKMSQYLIDKKKEEEQRAEEERTKALKEAEKQREIAEHSDGIDAELALMEAEMLESQALNIGIENQKAKNTVKTWKIKSVDSSKVPIDFNGVEIRPVNESAVLELIKKSNGNITIPGIEFEEDYIIRIR